MNTIKSMLSRYSRVPCDTLALYLLHCLNSMPQGKFLVLQTGCLLWDVLLFLLSQKKYRENKAMVKVGGHVSYTRSTWDQSHAPHTVPEAFPAMIPKHRAWSKR